MVFWCRSSCPKGGITSGEFASYYNGTTSDALYTNPTDVDSMKQYTYQASTGLLLDNSNSNAPVLADFTVAGFADPALSASFLIPDEYHQAHKTDDGYFAGLNDKMGKITSYSWSSGPSNGLKRVILVNSSNQPLTLAKGEKFFYTHTQEKDRLGRGNSPFYDVVMPMQITAWGAIQGVPFGPDETGYYRYAFAMKDGVAFGETVKLKGLFVEERMPPLDESQCSNVSLSNPPTLPSSSQFKDPSIGGKPNVSGAPSVISGVAVGGA
jgi:hypothetical protein